MPKGRRIKAVFSYSLPTKTKALNRMTNVLRLGVYSKIEDWFGSPLLYALDKGMDCKTFEELLCGVADRNIYFESDLKINPSKRLT